jgi:pentatricopeptide repeat domain-containing protein 1
VEGKLGIRYEEAVRIRGLQACCKEGAVDLALAIAKADVFAESLDTAGYNALISCFMRAGDYQKCFDVFDEMENQAVVQPNEATFGFLLEACSLAKDVKRAMDYLEKITHHGLPVNAVHSAIVIKGLVATNQVMDALRLLENFMKSEDRQVGLDSGAFYTLIKAFADSADMKRAIYVYELMKGRAIIPTEFVFNSLLNGCSMDGAMDSRALFSLMQRLLADGLQPNTATLSIVLKVLARCGAWDEALSLLEAAPDRFNMRVEGRLYVQLGQAAIKLGYRAKALEIHDAMVATKDRRGQEGCAASRWLYRQCTEAAPAAASHSRVKTSGKLEKLSFQRPPVFDGSEVKL